MITAITTRGRLLGLALAVAALAIGIGGSVLSGATQQAANAQSLELCGDEQRFDLCVTKETSGGDADFRFEYRADHEDDSTGMCTIAGVTEEFDDSFSLSDGESEGVSFGCTLRIVEVPQPGWQLVDISCQFNNEVWDVRRISSGLLIISNPSNFDSFLSDIDCTFFNRRIEERPLNLGGLFSGQPTPLPTAPAAVAPAATAPVITPPRTGDAGLK